MRKLPKMISLSMAEKKALRSWNKKIKPKRKKNKSRNKPQEVIKSYKVYIASPLWQKTKNKYFKKHGKKCECCGKTKYVTLHHKIYKGNYGAEKDNELIAFCYICHKLFHDTYGVKKDMQSETNIFVQEMKKNKNLLKEIENLDDQFSIMFK